MRFRQAIATRNHQIDRAERAPPRRASSRSLVSIDWVRSKDPKVKIRRTGKGQITMSGEASGTGGIAVALDALIYTVRCEAGDGPLEIARRLEERFGERYRVILLDAADGTATFQIALGRP